MFILKTKFVIGIYDDNSIRFFKVYDFYIFQWYSRIKNEKLIDELREKINVKS